MEPSLDQIEDYNGHESKEKRRTVNLVIIGLLLVGFAYTVIKYYDDAHQTAEPYVVPHTQKVK